MTLIFERNKYPLLFVALCLVTRSCQTHCDPVNCSPPESSIHGDSPDKNTGVGSTTHYLVSNVSLLTTLSG